MSKEELIATILLNAFPGEKISKQHYVLIYFIDLYFQKHKLAKEIYEKGHMQRKKTKEEERKNKLKEYLRWEFIRINLDKKHFNVSVEIGKIYNQINESNKRLTKEASKKFLIENLSKRLLELEFEENNLINAKALNYVIKL